jgi:hypothetical protein
MTVISVLRPSFGDDVARRSSDHNIVKYGSTILSAAGRLSQIWNNSHGFGPLRSSNGNISQWTMPFCREPPHVAPTEARRRAEESEWSTKPAART